MTIAFRLAGPVDSPVRRKHCIAKGIGQDFPALIIEAVIAAEMVPTVAPKLLRVSTCG